MSEMYRICHNCGASLTAGETYCPRCGAKYIEPIVQKPREFEPFPPDQSAASEQTEPQVAQQPVVLPPPPQMRSAPSPYAANRYGQQPPVRPGPGQVGGPPQPPNGDSGTGMRINLIISIIVGAVLLLLLVSGLFYFLGQRSNTTPGTTPTPGVTPTPILTPTATPTPGTTPTPTPTPKPVSFQVTTIDMAVSPLSIAGMPCGTQLTVTYTATLHVLPNGPGGTVQFMYTVDGGRTTKPGFVQFSPGATTMKYPFTSSGVLAQNGAFPGSGQVTTTSPNVISSQTVVPGGSCTPVTPTP